MFYPNRFKSWQIDSPRHWTDRLYVKYFEKEQRKEGDNPTIGLILCTDKNETMVKYTLLKENKQIFASKYKLYLPTTEELKKKIEREKEFFIMEDKNE